MFSSREPAPLRGVVSLKPPGYLKLRRAKKTPENYAKKIQLAIEKLTRQVKPTNPNELSLYTLHVLDVLRVSTNQAKNKLIRFGTRV